MKISIITVVYNNEKTIEEAINSVLSQDYQDIEYIIIDGKSTDNTMSIIRKFENKISLIISEPDKGIYDAMNKGISYATGNVIGILNSDDLYNDNQVIKHVMEKFLQDSNLYLLYGDLVYIKSNDTNNVVRRWKSKNYYSEFFENGNVPPHPSLFLKSEVYKEVGMFNTKYKLAAYYEFMLRIFKKYNFKSQYIPLLIVKMRLGGATNKSIQNIIKGNKEILSAWKDNGLNTPIFLMGKRFFKRIIQFIK